MPPEKARENLKLSKVEAHNLVQRIRQQLRTGIAETRRKNPHWDEHVDKFRMGEPYNPDQT